VISKSPDTPIHSLDYCSIACGQVVKSQLQQVGISVNLETLEFKAGWLPQVFTAHDYDMPIVAQVEPRDLPAVFGNPNYYTQYNNPQLQADPAPQTRAPRRSRSQI